MNVFDPFSTQPPSVFAAVVRMAAASLPEVDSVSPHAPIFSPRASGTRYRCFCCFGAEERDVGGAEPVVGRHRQGDRRIDAGQLFDADAVVDGGHAGAAVLFRKLDAHQSEGGELRDQLGGKLLRLIPLAHVRADLGLGELADAAAQQLLLRGQTKVHRRSDSTIMDS